MDRSDPLNRVREIARPSRSQIGDVTAADTSVLDQRIREIADSLGDPGVGEALEIILELVIRNRRTAAVAQNPLALFSDRERRSGQ